MANAVIYEKIATIEAQESITAVNADSFRKQLLDILRSQTASILLVDLGRVEFLDSAGLMALVAAYRVAKRLERGLSLCSVSPAVRIIFELTQLDERFDIYEDRFAFEAAIARS